MRHESLRRLRTRAPTQGAPPLQRVLARLGALVSMRVGTRGRGPVRAECRGEGADAGELEELDERHAATYGLAQADARLDHREGVGPEVEEVVVHSDLGRAEQLL